MGKRFIISSDKKNRLFWVILFRKYNLVFVGGGRSAVAELEWDKVCRECGFDFFFLSFNTKDPFRMAKTRIIISIWIFSWISGAETTTIILSCSVFNSRSFFIWRQHRFYIINFCCIILDSQESNKKTIVVHILVLLFFVN